MRGNCIKGAKKKLLCFHSTSLSQTALFLFRAMTDSFNSDWQWFFIDMTFDLKMLNDDLCNMIARHSCQFSASIPSMWIIWIDLNRYNISVGYALIEILSTTDRWSLIFFSLNMRFHRPSFFATLKNSKLKLTLLGLILYLSANVYLSL